MTKYHRLKRTPLPLTTFSLALAIKWYVLMEVWDYDHWRKYGKQQRQLQHFPWIFWGRNRCCFWEQFMEWKKRFNLQFVRASTKPQSGVCSNITQQRCRWSGTFAQKLGFLPSGAGRRWSCILWLLPGARPSRVVPPPPAKSRCNEEGYGALSS